MTLEQYVAHLNSLAFWKEFTFAKNKFSPQPGKELELADNFVWLEKYAFVLQLKQRSNETMDPGIERTWFRRKVLDKATSQVRDTLQFLTKHQKIDIINERGHFFEIRGAEIDEIIKIVVFLGGQALPEDCRQVRYYISQKAGFIHILEARDYLGILETLRVPEDIRRYFVYREKVTQKLHEAKSSIQEECIMGAFLGEERIPTLQSKERLRLFVQDIDGFDLSPLMTNLHDHIYHADRPYDYYQIMLQFARIPRSVWREIKIRFKMSLEAVQNAEFTRPFRMTFPATDCSFMIAPLDPNFQSTGLENQQIRITGLKNFTNAAMYEGKTSIGIGILISKNGEYIHIDWALLNIPWKPDPEMDARLAKNNPFREAKAKMFDSFLFVLE